MQMFERWRKSMGMLTVVTSGKGGTGKSTVSVGLATAFSKLSKSVLLIDIDEGLRCLDLMLGVSDRLVFDLNDIITYNKPYHEAMLQVNSNINLIPAPSSAGTLNKQLFGKFLYDISDDFDVIIVDCPAGIDKELYSFLPKFSSVVVVEPLNAIGCRSATAIENVLTSVGISNKYLILNKFDYFIHKYNGVMSLDDIVDKTGLMLKGVIPYDPGLALLSANGKLYEKCLSYKAFYRIAKRLLFCNIPLPKLNSL